MTAMANKKPDNMKRDKQFLVMVRASEKAAYKKVAESQDLSMSDWARRLLNAAVDELSADE
ncbi:MAG: hypothetical protein ABGZ53_11755 [Fuerstiella sp.]